MAATQKGTTLMIAFGSLTYTGYVAEDMTVSKPDGNVEVIRDANGATLTKIYMDPGTRIQGTFVILGTGSITAPAQGDSIGLVPPGGTLTTFCVESADVKFAAGATRLTVDIIKESSMTYT